MLLPVLAFCGALGGLDFERDVRPILADACFRCHGPDGGARKAGLRLDLRDGLFGPIREPAAIAHVVEPAHPEASELWRRVSASLASIIFISSSHWTARGLASCARRSSRASAGVR